MLDHSVKPEFVLRVLTLIFHYERPSTGSGRTGFSSWYRYRDSRPWWQLRFAGVCSTSSSFPYVLSLSKDARNDIVGTDE